MSEIGGMESLGMEGRESGVDAAALERLREQLRENQRQAAKDTKKESKQKKQEVNLGDIIVALLQNSGAAGLLKVVTHALASGLPADFILNILALRFTSIREKVGVNLGNEVDIEQTKEAVINNQSLIPGNFSNEALPLQVAIELNLWVKHLITSSKNNAEDLLPKISLKTQKNQNFDFEAKAEFKNLVSYIIQDYLQSKKLPFNGQNVVLFSSKFCDSLVDYLVAHIQQTN